LEVINNPNKENEFKRMISTYIEKVKEKSKDIICVINIKNKKEIVKSRIN